MNIETIPTEKENEFIVIVDGVNRGLFVTKTGVDQIPQMLSELDADNGGVNEA